MRTRWIKMVLRIEKISVYKGAEHHAYEEFKSLDELSFCM